MKAKQIFSGIFMLLLATSLEAAVVYTNITDYTVSEGTDYGVDLNQDGTVEFTLTSAGGSVGCMFDTDQLNFITWSAASDWDAFKPVAAGTMINASSGFYAQGDCYFNPFWAASSSMIPLNTDVFIGIWFKTGSNIHYAWARVNLPSAGTLIVKDFAYENTAGYGISAGNTGSTAAIANAENFSVNVFPNPTVDWVKTEMRDVSDYVVRIIDTEGQVLCMKRISDARECVISTRDLARGTYFITVEKNAGSVYKSPLIVL